MMAHEPDDDETISSSGLSASGEDGGAQSGAAATFEDPERTVVVPGSASHADEEPTVVVDRKPAVDDPERTLVAPTPVEPQRITDPRSRAVGPADSSTRSAADAQGEQTLHQQPRTHQRASAPTGPPAAPAPPSPQHPNAGVAPSFSPSGAPQPGFGPRPFPYGQPNPYPFPPPAPYAGPPYGPGGHPGRPRSKQTRTLVWGGVGLAAVVLGAGLVIGLCNPDLVSTKKLDVQAAESEIQRVLTDDITGYGDKNVADVKCNNGENVTIKQGSSFTCQVSVDGTSRRLTATFLDNNGNFDVGRPD